MRSFLNQNYLTWLHELTTLAYDHKFMITMEMNDQVRRLWQLKTTPADAIHTLIGMDHAGQFKTKK